MFTNGFSGRADSSRTIPLSSTSFYPPNSDPFPLDVQGALERGTFSPRRRVFIFDDFIGPSAGNMIGWGTNSAGTGAAYAVSSTGVNATDRCIGVAQISTGTTSTGFFNLRQANLGILFGYTDFFQVMRIQLPNISTAAERFGVYLGLTDTNASFEGNVDAVTFFYQDDVSANWRCRTMSNSTMTDVDSGVTVTAGTWYTMAIKVPAGGGSAQFFINDNLVATITTNIPTGTGRQTGIAYKIGKSTGTTERTLLLDYHYHEFTWPTERFP